MYEKPWSHAPVRRLIESGTYMVTGATYLKKHYFAGREALDQLQNSLFSLVDKYSWTLRSWSIFPNHYHLVGVSPDEATSLRSLLNEFHRGASEWANLRDEQPGRKVWYQFWDSQLTYERSYLARLRYVHNNPVHHGLVKIAEEYPWCSARWFAETAPRSFVNTVNSFKIDRLNIRDDF